MKCAKDNWADDVIGSSVAIKAPAVSTGGWNNSNSSLVVRELLFRAWPPRIWKVNAQKAGSVFLFDAHGIAHLEYNEDLYMKGAAQEVIVRFEIVKVLEDQALHDTRRVVKSLFDLSILDHRKLQLCRIANYFGTWKPASTVAAKRRTQMPVQSAQPVSFNPDIVRTGKYGPSR